MRLRWFAMSVLTDSALRWSATMIFGISMAADIVAISDPVLDARGFRWTWAIDHLLHLSMSAAMIAMAWRVGPVSHSPGPVVFFLLAAGWFVLMAGRHCAAGDRIANCYNATMMVAMAWMYTLMNGAGHPPDHAMAGPATTHLAGSSMPAHQMPQARPESWVTTANWIVAVAFAVAAVHWFWRYLAARRADRCAGTGPLTGLGLLSQALAAAGTALMFGAMR